MGDSVREWRERLSLSLEARRERGLYREPSLVEGKIDFASNDYLSLNSSGVLSRLLEEVAPYFREGRVGSTGSRLMTGHHEVYERAEAIFAAYAGFPSALLFHSGYGANVGALSALLSSADTVFCDRLSHASLMDGIRLSGAKRYYFRHNDPEDLERLLSLHRRRQGEKRGRSGALWIVTETLFSMDGDLPPLRELTELGERYGALLYVDEAHAIGVLGPGGRGVAASFGLQEKIAVSVFPLGKAPGLMGAFVCGPPELKPFLVNHARSFFFSTSQPLPLVELLIRVIEILGSAEAEELRNRLASHSRQLRNRLKGAGLDTGSSVAQIVPLYTGDSERALRLQELCFEADLDVRAIRSPTVPEGSARLRINLHAGNTAEEIDLLGDVLIGSSEGSPGPG